MAMGDVEVDYAKLCDELELQEQEVNLEFLFSIWSSRGRNEAVLPPNSRPNTGKADCYTTI